MADHGLSSSNWGHRFIKCVTSERDGYHIECGEMNSPCNHQSWLAFSSEKENTLRDSGRLARLLLELTNPSLQRPSVLFYLGRRAKTVALRPLYPCNNFGRSQHDGLATLTADTLSLQSDYPVFFAESDPVSGGLPEAGSPNAQCHETISYPIQWRLPHTQRVYDVIHARLTCTFVDVLCIFADDFRNFDEVLFQLQTWAVLGRATDQFRMARPRAIIVKQGTDPGPSATYDLLQSENMSYNLHRTDLVQFFSSMTILYLADEQISSLARHRRLKELIQRQTEEVRHIKQSIGCLFSADHLCSLFSDAIKHTAQTMKTPFDFLASSRLANPVSPAFPQHLEGLLRLCRQGHLSYRFYTSIIASSVLLDAYPPGMHGERFPMMAGSSKLTTLRLRSRNRF